MLLSRRKKLALSGAGLVLLGGIGLVCCNRPAGTDMSASQAPAAESAEPAKTARPALIQPQDTAERQADDAPAPIEMEHPQQPEPPTPRYLSVVEQIDPRGPAKVTATITMPRKLELETDNVRRLRVTREGLPLARDRSIVLRIDGQGIEWTREYVAVELERSSAGAWSVAGRRPAKP